MKIIFIFPFSQVIAAMDFEMVEAVAEVEVMEEVMETAISITTTLVLVLIGGKTKLSLFEKSSLSSLTKLLNFHIYKTNLS